MAYTARTRASWGCRGPDDAGRWQTGFTRWSEWSGRYGRRRDGDRSRRCSMGSARSGARPGARRRVAGAHGRDPGRVEGPASPDARAPGVGCRCLHPGGGAGGRLRTAGGQPDVGPPGPRRARPGQPGVVSALGGLLGPPPARPLPYRRQPDHDDLLRFLRGTANPRTPSWPSAAPCCSSGTPGS